MIDGVPMYHLVGKGSEGFESLAYEEYGTVYQDQVVKLILDLDGRATPQERQAIRDQVVTTFRWR